MPAHLTNIKRMVQGRFTQRFLKNKKKLVKLNVIYPVKLAIFLLTSALTAKMPLPRFSRELRRSFARALAKKSRRQLCQQVISLTILLTR